MKNLYAGFLISTVVLGCSSHEVISEPELVDFINPYELPRSQVGFNKFDDIYVPGVVIDRSAPQHALIIATNDTNANHNNIIFSDSVDSTLIFLGGAVENINNNSRETELKTDPSVTVPAISNVVGDLDNNSIKESLVSSKSLMDENFPKKTVGKPIVDCDCDLEPSIFFELDSSVLSEASLLSINSLDVKGKELEVIGYADLIGGDLYNQKLAFSRARSVRDVLMHNGAKEVITKLGLQSEFEGPKFRTAIIVGL